MIAVKSQMSKARCQKPEARSQKPEARCQKPDARSQTNSYLVIEFYKSVFYISHNSLSNWRAFFIAAPEMKRDVPQATRSLVRHCAARATMKSSISRSAGHRRQSAIL